ncbi:hypothetical protein EV401DRAFT_2068753 [Pisolithus croceorrhizus]|nr:hypothetical protein EV401DRAFT_2068753 [Pisolithus croceorrhizus]
MDISADTFPQGLIDLSQSHVVPNTRDPDKACPAFDEWQGQNKMFCKAANYATWAHPPFLFPLSIHSMCLQCQSPRKQPYTCDSSHRYNLCTRLSTPSPCASRYSPPAPRATYPTSKRIRFASISSTSSLSSVFATPPSSPSAPTLLAESYPLECEIKTTNDQIANLMEFLTNEVATSHKERDEIALEAERLKELAACYSSEATRLQKLRDTDLGGVDHMWHVQRPMHPSLLNPRVQAHVLSRMSPTVV